MQSHSYHVFSLPIEILDSLTPRRLLAAPEQDVTTPEHTDPRVSTEPNSRTCNVCLRTFGDLSEQRGHFRSDWHRYNVKSRMNNRQAVTEVHFTELVESLEDSLSGSASSSDEGTSDTDAVNTLVNKNRRKSRPSSPDATAPTSVPQTALAWFHSPPTTQIGIYKSLFPAENDPFSYVSYVKAMQKDAERTWAMFMVAGGHFAGAVVQVSRSKEAIEEGSDLPGKKKKPQKAKPDTEVVLHKTFHRYTTRRKQGGSQSINDNAKGNAKSAGAQLRRYGEQALRDDIRNLLSEWADEISQCERIWIRASGSNRKIFLDYEGAIIAKNDPRLRTFPFPTRRPTQAELTRCLTELTRAKVSHFTEQELLEQDEAYLASLPKPKAVPQPNQVLTTLKPKAPKLSKEEEAFREKWSRLFEMVTKGRIEPLKAFWEREGATLGGVNAFIPEWLSERRGTLLQVASQAGHVEVTQWLLEEARADPTTPIPKYGPIDDEDGDGRISDTSDSPRALAKGGHKTAYDFARTKEIRDVYRRCAGEHPDWWDWFGAARVPSALSKEMEEEREEKKKVRRKGLKERVKERELKDKQKERPAAVPETVQSAQPEVTRSETSGPRRLGGAAGASDGVAGLTPEMRAKVERERRARAAEARLKRT